MWRLHAFTLTSRPTAQGMIIGAKRYWMSSRRKADERSRDVGFSRVFGVGKKEDPKRSPFAQSRTGDQPVN